MTPVDFQVVAKEVYKNLDHINRYLGKAKIASKFLPNGTSSSADLPGALLALAKENDTDTTNGATGSDPAERPSEQEIDTLFDTIRSRSATAATNNKHHRQGSVKKTATAPLQQSRLLNETNLLANSTSVLTSSCADLTKYAAIDVDALVDRLRQAIGVLGSIENSQILSVDVVELHQRFRREWTSIVKTCRNVETLLDEFQQQAKGNGPNGTARKEPLISIEMVNAMKQLQTKLHHAVLVKKSEVLPDLTKTLSKEVFPLSECLDMIDETISQKQL
uniref:Uncharacterized protein n=1 Tax=Anopheles dirus TaxID=7168 RepID=A0A182NPU5_9DIPT